MSKEVILNQISRLNIDSSKKTKLSEATEKSFSPQSRGKFDCYQAVAYINGDLDSLEEELREYPGYRQLTTRLRESGMVCVSEPERLLDIAIVKILYDAYHIGLVVNTNPLQIWAKRGSQEANITELEGFSNYRDSQGKVEFFTSQQKT